MRDWSQFGPLVVDIHGDKSLSTNWPDPEELPTREDTDDLFNLPSDPVKARNRAERWLEDTQKELQRDFERYNDLREKGQGAVSEFDINICAGGNAARALGQALQLKTNHITYGKTKVRAYKKYLAGQIEGVEIQLGFAF